MRRWWIYLYLVIAIVFIVPFVEAGCCVNEPYSSVLTDVTCNAAFSASDCIDPDSFVEGDCLSLSACGCCVCDVDASPFLYSSGETVNEAFCDDFCTSSGKPYSFFAKTAPSACLKYAEKTIVSGSVIDGAGLPIEGALVEDLTHGSTTTTASDGSYSLEIFSISTSVRASKEGVSKTITVDTTVKKTGWDIVLSFGDLVTISGAVTDTTTGSPIEGMRIYMSGTDFVTRSGHSGVYTLSVPAGDYVLIAEPAEDSCGYKTVRTSISVVTTTAKDIMVDKAPTEEIFGFIRDTAGVPIEGVSIILDPLRGNPSTSDETGRYIVTAVPTCPYSITVQKRPQYLDASKPISVTSEDSITSNRLDFVLEAGNPCIFGNLLVPRGSCDQTRPRCCSYDGQKITNCCFGADKTMGTADDCGCDSGLTCNEETGACEEKPGGECCTYAFQCKPSSAINTQDQGTCAANQVNCKNACLKVSSCPIDVKLREQNVDTVCSCGGDVSVDLSVSKTYNIPYVGGSYCCEDGGIPFISDSPCAFQNKALIQGTVTSSNTGDPIDAFVILDPDAGKETKVTTIAFNGKYSLYVEPLVAHTLVFKKDPFYIPETKAVPGFSLDVGAVYTLNVALDQNNLYCDYPTAPPVSEFSGSHVKCKPFLNLSWNNNYCENVAGVTSFRITNEHTGDLFDVDGSVSSLLVEDLEWDTDYSFSIQAFYTDANTPRFSEKTYLDEPFNPGDSQCATRCDSAEFCFTETLRRRCDDDNQISDDVSTAFFKDCGLHKTLFNTEHDWLCAKADEGETKCVQSSLCGFDQTEPQPFLGLLFTDKTCSFDALGPRNCYLDYSSTTVDFCYECPTGNEGGTCYQYASPFACDRNRCGVDSECGWHPNAYGVFGEGVCFDKVHLADYKYNLKRQDVPPLSNCQLCNEKGTLFYNTECNQDVCSRIGFCYEDEAANSCTSCREDLTLCTQFTSKESCNDATGRSTNFALESPSNPKGMVISDDACGLGRCFWDDTTSSCFKDGDSDREQDCLITQGDSSILDIVCERDLEPPSIRPLFTAPLLSGDPLSEENLLDFEVTDNAGGFESFYYCIGPESEERCIDYRKVLAVDPDLVSDTLVTVNPLLDFPERTQTYGTYVVRFYAVDRHKNIGLVKERLVAIDPEAPEIVHQYESTCVNCDQQLDCSEGSEYRSRLDIRVNSNEHVTCEEILVAPGQTIEDSTDRHTFTVGIENAEQHSYPKKGIGVVDGIYDYYLSCHDDAGNTATIKDEIKVDAFTIIKKIEPKGPLFDSAVRFDVETGDATTCEIQLDNKVPAIMKTSAGGFSHSFVKLLQRNTYHYYAVRCTETASIGKNRCDSETLEFAIDQLPPKTVAVINGKNYSSENWTVFVTDATTVTLVPDDPFVDEHDVRFGVKETTYCTRGANAFCTPGALVTDITTPFPSTIQIPVADNTAICYEAVDHGGNRETANCGRVLIGTPTAVFIEHPKNGDIVSELDVFIDGYFGEESSASAVAVISNGKEQLNISLSIEGQTFTGILPFLYSGYNLITVVITNTGGISSKGSIVLYYDNQGPNIEPLTPEIVPYGEEFAVAAIIRDINVTALKTGDNIGEVTSAEFIIEAHDGTYSESFILEEQANGKWSSTIKPKLEDELFYDILPGLYTITYKATDSYGNLNIEKQQIEVKDSEPTTFTIQVVESGDKDGGVFYTRDKTPYIRVVTDETSTCKIKIITHNLIHKLTTSNSLEHTYTDPTYLSFSDKNTTFRGIIACKDSLGGLPDDGAVTIIYDIIPPELFLAGTGRQFVEKDIPFVSVNQRNSKGQLSSTIVARDRYAKEQIKCTLQCNKDGESCGLYHEQKILPDLSSGYQDVLEEEILFDLADGNERYEYTLYCQDRAGNPAVGKNNILLQVDEDEPYAIIKASPHLVTATLDPVLEIKTNRPSSSCVCKGCGSTLFGFLKTDIPFTTFSSKDYLEYYTLTLKEALVEGTFYELPIECRQFGHGNVARKSLRFLATSSLGLSVTAPSGVVDGPITLSGSVIEGATATVHIEDSLGFTFYEEVFSGPTFLTPYLSLPVGRSEITVRAEAAGIIDEKKFDVMYEPAVSKHGLSVDVIKPTVEKEGIYEALKDILEIVGTYNTDSVESVRIYHNFQHIEPLFKKADSGSFAFRIPLQEDKQIVTIELRGFDGSIEQRSFPIVRAIHGPKVISSSPSRISEAAFDLVVETDVPAKSCTVRSAARHNKFNIPLDETMAVIDGTHFSKSLVIDPDEPERVFQLSIVCEDHAGHVEHSAVAVHFDAVAPQITDVTIQTADRERGIFRTEKTESLSSYTVVDGVNDGSFTYALVAHVSNPSECRFASSDIPFSDMTDHFKPGFTREKHSYFMLADDESTKKHVVRCKNDVGIESKPYTVTVTFSSDEPVHITSVEPMSYTNTADVELTATMSRNGSCTYSRVGDPLGQVFPMRSVRKRTGYEFSSSVEPGKTLHLDDGYSYIYKIHCMYPGVLGSETDVSFMVDTKEPVLSVTSPKEEQTVHTTRITVTGVTEPNATIYAYVNDILKKTFVASDDVFSFSLYLDVPGKNSILLSAVDKAGNKQTTPLTVYATPTRPRAWLVAPLSGTVPIIEEIVAHISGDFSEVHSSFTVTGPDGIVSGSLFYDSINGTWTFSPTSALTSGDYFVNVVPRTSEHKEGYGFESRFTILATTPPITWTIPDTTTYGTSEDKLYIEHQGTSGDYIRTANLNQRSATSDYLLRMTERDNWLYHGIVLLQDSINYVLSGVADLFGQSNMTRLFVLDQEGPVAFITPAGVISDARPIIDVQFTEDVEILFFSLHEYGNEEHFFETTIISEDPHGFKRKLVSQLTADSYEIVVTARDKFGNEHTTRQPFVIDIGDVLIELVVPPYGVSASSEFDLELRTNQDAFCRYSNLVVDSFEQYAPFEVSGANRHVKKEFTVASIYPQLQKLYVLCDGALSGMMKSPKVFDLSYDLTPPVIVEAKADPSLIVSFPLRTTLEVRTDDEVRCKYDCMGSITSYDLMSDVFNNDTDIFSRINLLEYDVEDKKKYSCNVICENKALLRSDLATIEFEADTSLSPQIRIQIPKHGAAYSNVTLPLKFTTDSIAECSYTLDGDAPHSFPSADTLFEDSLSLTVGKHTVDVHCIFVDGGGTARSLFVIDTTAPTDVAVNDGNVSCSDETLSVSWSAVDEESGIKQFHYAIKTEGTTEYNIKNFTTTSSTVLEKFPSLEEGITYYFAVKAENNAGIITGETISDGVYLDSSRPECFVGEVSPPTAQVVTYKEPGQTLVSLFCEDESGCKPERYYGLSIPDETCIPNILFNDTLTLSEAKTFCYLVENIHGLTAAGEQLIEIGEGIPEGFDDDGDGVANDRDLCPGTPFAAAVNEVGCPDSDFDGLFDNEDNCINVQNIDQENLDGDAFGDACDDDIDGDGMPNEWELQYGFDPRNSEDGALDFDNDSLTNADEFTYGTNPHLADTDGDGYSDYDELFGYDIQYDPNDPESYPPSYLWLYILLLVIIIITVVSGYYVYVYYKHKKATEAAHPRLRPSGVPEKGIQRRERIAPRLGMRKPMVVSPEERRRRIASRLRDIKRFRKKQLRKELFDKFGGKRAAEKKLGKEVVAKREITKKKKLEKEFNQLEALVKKEDGLDSLLKQAKGTLKKDEFEQLEALSKGKKDIFSELAHITGKQKQENKNKNNRNRKTKQK